MLAVTDADYRREYDKAKAEGNEERMAAIETAYEIMQLLEFDDLERMADVIRACAVGHRKATVFLGTQKTRELMRRTADGK